MPQILRNPELKQLPIGGTYFVPSVDVDTIIRRIGHYKPLRFSCRTVVRNGVVGVRVRRVA